MFSFQFKRIRGQQKVWLPRGGLLTPDLWKTSSCLERKKSKKKERNIRTGKPVETAATMEKSKTLRCFFPQVAWIKPSEKRARFYPQLPQARRRLTKEQETRKQKAAGYTL